MVFETPKRQMDRMDFQVLGVDLYQRGAGPHLPNRRLEIPLPPGVDELHQIHHAIAALAIELREAANTSPSGRHAVMGMEYAIRNWNARMLERRREWEGELADRLGSVEQIKKTG